MNEPLCRVALTAGEKKGPDRVRARRGRSCHVRVPCAWCRFQKNLAIRRSQCWYRSCTGSESSSTVLCDVWACSVMQKPASLDVSQNHHTVPPLNSGTARRHAARQPYTHTRTASASGVGRESLTHAWPHTAPDNTTSQQPISDGALRCDERRPRQSWGGGGACSDHHHHHHQIRGRHQQAAPQCLGFTKVCMRSPGAPSEPPHRSTHAGDIDPSAVPATLPRGTSASRWPCGRQSGFPGQCARSRRLDGSSPSPR